MILIMEFYYKEIKWKKTKKKRLTIKSFYCSSFNFGDSIYNDFKNDIDYNTIILQTYKYTVIQMIFSPE